MAESNGQLPLEGLSPRDSIQLDIREISAAEPSSSNAAEADVNDELREKRRQAGEEYFNRALGLANKGQDPFAAPVQSKRQRSKRNAGRIDPDLLAFEQMFEGSKAYVYMAIYVASQALGPVLVKGSLYWMQTPAVLTFLHMLSAVGALFLANSYEVFDVNGITVQNLKGCAVRVVLFAVQMVCVFSSLHHNSVNFVLVWTQVGGPLVEMGLSYVVHRQQPAKEMRPFIYAAVGAAVLEMVLDTDTVWVGYLMMGLWSLSKGVEWGWKQLKVDATAGGLISNFGLISRVRELSDEEDILSSPKLALLQNALPAVPVLLAGFIALEGREIVHHELSVPAVTVMLLACAAYVAATGCQLLLDDKLPAMTKLYLRSAATLGTIVLFYMEEHRTISHLAVLCTLVSTSAAAGIAWLQRRSL